MKQLLLAAILLASIFCNSQTVIKDSTGNYYSETKPKLLKMNVDDRGLISYVYKQPNGEEKGMDYETFEEFNKFFGFEYTGKSYTNDEGKFPVYTTASGKLYVLRTSDKTGLVYKSYLKVKP
mgnify:CR=1 FL=1